MAVLDFPVSPSLNQIYSTNGKRWQWNGTSWIRIPDPGIQGIQGVQGVQGLQGIQGIQGLEGNFGGASFDYTFDSSTTASDPGTGKLRLNNSNLTVATRLYIDDTDDNGTNLDNFLQTIDDSTSTIKGHFRISNKGNNVNFALYTITSLTDNGGWYDVLCSYVSGSVTTFSNTDIVITFARTGDKGDTGSQGTQGVQGPQGIQGITGIQGIQGSGIQGIQGTQGITGSQGVQGIIGSFTSWIRKTSSYTANNGEQIIADTTGGAFTINLPASPTLGYFVRIADGGDWSTNNLTIGRNGTNIEGGIEDFVLNIKGIIVEFVYEDVTSGWQVYAYTGPGTSGGGSSTTTSVIDLLEVMLFT